MVVRTNTNNWVAFGAAAAALLLVIVTVFVEWGAFDFEGETSGSMGMGGTSFSDTQPYTLFQLDDTSWFDNDMDDVSGIGQIRTGIVVFLVGAAVALGGTTVLAVPPRVMSRSVIGGAALCLAGAVVVGLGALLHHLGATQTADMFTGSNGFVSNSTTLAVGTGLIMGYVAAILLLAAGIFGLAWKPAAPMSHGA